MFAWCQSHFTHSGVWDVRKFSLTRSAIIKSALIYGDLPELWDNYLSCDIFFFSRWTQSPPVSCVKKKHSWPLELHCLSLFLRLGRMNCSRQSQEVDEDTWLTLTDVCRCACLHSVTVIGIILQQKLKAAAQWWDYDVKSAWIIRALRSACSYLPAGRMCRFAWSNILGAYINTGWTGLVT